MKVSVSLPAEDLAFVDAYAKAQGFPSRSAVVHQAIRLLRASQLGAAYESAWADWADAGDAELWDVTVGDGVHA